MKIHRDAMQHAAMGSHYANDVARQLAIMSVMEHLPPYMLPLMLERLDDCQARMNASIEAMRVFLFMPPSPAAPPAPAEPEPNNVTVTSEEGA